MPHASKPAESEAAASEPHLWEKENEGYWADRAYHAAGSEPSIRFKSWQDFIEVHPLKEPDFADWTILGFTWNQVLKISDPYYRNGRLELYVLMRRKGWYAQFNVEVCEADEPAVKEYLSVHAAKLRSLWGPVMR